jgi:predicted DNA-binding transcriptional regulator YafY
LKGTSTTFTKVKGVPTKKFRPDESKSIVQQLNSWSSRRDDLQCEAEQKKQKQANSRKKPLERECAALKSDYN